MTKYANKCVRNFESAIKLLKYKVSAQIIYQNWEISFTLNLIKCTYKCFNNSGNINHKNDSKICPKVFKKIKNSQSKVFSESDTTTFCGYFYITAYVSKIFGTLRLVSAWSHVTQLLDKVNPFLLTHFPCVSPLLGGPNRYTKQCEQYIFSFLMTSVYTSVYFANIQQLLNLF